jgi:hypothetical protein
MRLDRLAAAAGMTPRELRERLREEIARQQALRWEKAQAERAKKRAVSRGRE